MDTKKLDSPVTDEKDISLPSEQSRPTSRKPKLEDYIFYAQAQRRQEAIEEEADIQSGLQKKQTTFSRRIAHKLQRLTDGMLPTASSSTEPDDALQTAYLNGIETDKVNAWRALRQTTLWGAFFLSTTDILGPFNAPYAVRQNGYVPGTLLYVFMGGMAFYCGVLLWWLYVRLDSARFPVKSYSDITERVAGWPLRIVVTWLVFIHMIVNVAHSSLSAAQSLYQLAHGKLCFVVAIVIWIVVGSLLNQIRSLKRYSWIARGGIFINILIILLSVGFIAHSPPNYAAAKASYGIAKGPVHHQAFASYPFYSRINGVMNIVYAYGGATIFPQIIAEMRRPMDYLKAFSIAQLLIFVIYVFYGLYVYSFQGQFTVAVAFQGISKYSFQTVCNVLYLISTMIGAGLYGNVGLKVFYVNVIEKILHGPQLPTKKGRIYWTVLVFVFWWVGFVIAAAIPQVQTLSGMVGAATRFVFLYLVQLDAATEDGEYVPGLPPQRIDSWTQWSRWRRGLFGGKASGSIWLQLFKWFNFWVSMAALATAGLGIYGSGLSIAHTFDSSAATSFGCAAPV